MELIEHVQSKVFMVSNRLQAICNLPGQPVCSRAWSLLDPHSPKTRLQDLLWQQQLPACGYPGVNTRRGNYLCRCVWCHIRTSPIKHWEASWAYIDRLWDSLLGGYSFCWINKIHLPFSKHYWFYFFFLVVCNIRVDYMYKLCIKRIISPILALFLSVWKHLSRTLSQIAFDMAFQALTSFYLQDLFRSTNP